MLIRGYTHTRLMAESETRVEMAAFQRTPADAVVRHILRRPDIYRRWEAEHDRLLRPVSAQAHLLRQVVALRSAAFALVHRRALFEYLRERELSRSKRRRLLLLFYGCRDYTNALLHEHGNYVRCSSSHVSTQHLAEHLMRDVALDEPLQLYEQFYREYFSAYCDWELAETEAERQAVAPLEALKPLLKYRLTEARQAILAMPHQPDREWREVRIRKPNGDTQRMRMIFGAN
jgi:hypothetical protein